jgi:hypothetical protein|mmetsp:Transcript_4450/g.8179  ORF Transcript_4450/g.8179 Transcript_4450/m.8179 type:complete len:237 (-) Transcript_4450:596-1306(-)
MHTAHRVRITRCTQSKLIAFVPRRIVNTPQICSRIGRSRSTTRVGKHGVGGSVCFCEVRVAGLVIAGHFVRNFVRIFKQGLLAKVAVCMMLNLDEDFMHRSAWLPFFVSMRSLPLEGTSRYKQTTFTRQVHQCPHRYAPFTLYVRPWLRLPLCLDLVVKLILKQIHNYTIIQLYILTNLSMRMAGPNTGANSGNHLARQFMLRHSMQSHCAALHSAVICTNKPPLLPATDRRVQRW